MKMNQKGVAPIIIAIIVVLLLGVGGYAVVKTNPGLSQKLGMEKRVVKKESVETNDWKTYNDSLYTFLYPADWTVWEANPQQGLTIIYPNSKSKEVLNKTISATDEITVAIVGGTTSGSKKIILNDRTWYVQDFGGKLDGGTEKGLHYYTTVATDKYIEITSGVSNRTIVEAVAESFKSVSASTTVTSDWKTYRSEKYGFEIEYPKQWEIGADSVKSNNPENSTSFMTLIMAYVKEPEINVSVSTEKAQDAIAKIQKIIDARFAYSGSVGEVAKDISKESSRYQVYNFTNPNGVKIYSYSFVGKYSETSRHFFFDTAKATIVFSVTPDTMSCAKGCAFATENEAFLAASALRHWIDSITLSASGQTNNWKTYTNEKFGFEIKYPANYFIYDYGVIPDTAVTAAVIGITDSKKTYDSTSNNKVVVYVSKLPVGFKNSEEYLKYMHASYPAMREIKVTKENRVDLGGVEGLQFFGVQKDSETGREANIQSILGYSDKTGYEVVSWSSDFPLFSTILSTFKLTEKDSLIVPSSEQQSVINYLQANITKMIKAKPVLGATKWSFYQIAFYPANKVLVLFEDGHITGGFLGSYSMNDDQVSVAYIAEVINTGDEDKKLSEKYSLAAEAAVKFKQTSGSGFELIK